MKSKTHPNQHTTLLASPLPSNTLTKSELAGIGVSITVVLVGVTFFVCIRRKAHTSVTSVGQINRRPVEEAAITSEDVKSPPARTYLAVPYSEKDCAKALGAKWDADQKKWFLPPGRDISNFTKWLPQVENDEESDDSDDEDFREAERIPATLYLAKAAEVCWKCSTETEVVTIATTVGSYPVLFLLNYIESLPVPLVKYFNMKFPNYYKDSSAKAGFAYFMNHCSSCGAKMGDNYMYSEPGDTFYPQDLEDMRHITLIKTNLPITGVDINGVEFESFSVRINCGHLAVPNDVMEFAETEPYDRQPILT